MIQRFNIAVGDSFGQSDDLYSEQGREVFLQTFNASVDVLVSKPSKDVRGPQYQEYGTLAPGNVLFTPSNGIRLRNAVQGVVARATVLIPEGNDPAAIGYSPNTGFMSAAGTYFPSTPTLATLTVGQLAPYVVIDLADIGV